MKPNLIQAKQRAVEALLHADRPGNVVGVGIGEKSGAACLQIYVVSRLLPNYLCPGELVPPSFDDVPTEVVQIGRLGRKGHPRRPDPNADLTPKPGSPIRLQTNAPNVNSGARGTLGAVVEVDGAGQRYILGCNHVLAANGRIKGDNEARVVSAEFVGQEASIANPGVYIPLDRHAKNFVDCALAPIIGSQEEQARTVRQNFPKSIEKLTSGDPIKPELGMHVKKIGAATGPTDGKIVDVDAFLYVDYSFGRFRFEEQIVIEGEKDDEEFATAGDSGSIIVDQETGRPVAMVFAASGKYAIACKLSVVMSKLEEELRKKLQDDPERRLQVGKGNAGKVKLSLLIK